MSNDIHSDRILILDFGSQYTQLIARRVREAGVYCEIFPYDVDEEHIREFSAKGYILSGGPESVTEGDTPKASQLVFDSGMPVLGICYGMQTMAAQLGGEVETSLHHEYGYAQIRARGHSSLLRDIEDHTSAEGYGLLDVWMSHGDRVVSLPPGLSQLLRLIMPRWLAWQMNHGIIMASSFIPKLHTRNRATGYLPGSFMISVVVLHSGTRPTSFRTVLIIYSNR